MGGPALQPYIRKYCFHFQLQFHLPSKDMKVESIAIACNGNITQGTKYRINTDLPSSSFEKAKLTNHNTNEFETSA